MPDILTSDIGATICSFLAESQRNITLIAPFITLSAFERLIAFVPSQVSVTVFTRWKLDEIARGASDLRIFDTIQARSAARLLLNDNLHAKAVVVDEAIAIVGSANITNRALGFSDRRNIEVMVDIRPVPNAIFLLVRNLERSSTPATADLRDHLHREAEAIAALLPPTISNYPELFLAPPLFPCFRTPERLYAGYRSVLSVHDPEARTLLLDDLLTLCLPHDLSESDFNKAVAKKLLLRPEFAAFDEFVREPRYFHELVSWLQSRDDFASLNNEARKRFAQILIRWLMFFCPQRYRLDEPNYSERFTRVV